MNKYTLLLVFITSTLFAQTPCVNNMAGIYPCAGYDLLSHIAFTDMGATNLSDSWGWVDPTNDKEYAILGLDNGTGFVDISDPLNPIYLGKLPTATGTALAWDIKTYNDYAFIVTDNNGPHGMQIFDLTKLRSVTSPPVTFSVDASYNGFENAHNLAINEDTGYAYALRTNTFSSGVHFINIQDPLNPIAAGGLTGVFTHDAQIVTYQGPDSDYTGREILISYNGFDGDITIADVTDKSNPQIIEVFAFSNTEHAHQGWFTEDQRYLIIGDEFDELNLGFSTRTVVYDMEDLDNPVESFEYYGGSTASDHNGYTLGDRYYMANYAAGMRVISISDIDNGNMNDLGYFDVYPTNNDPGFNGAWTAYPYFPSGNIMISALSFNDPNYTGGLFLVRESTLGTADDQLASSIAIQPNPTQNQLSIDVPESLAPTSLTIYDATGRMIQTGVFEATLDLSGVASGLLFIEIDTNQGSITKKVIKE